MSTSLTRTIELRMKITKYSYSENRGCFGSTLIPFPNSSTPFIFATASSRSLSSSSSINPYPRCFSVYRSTGRETSVLQLGSKLYGGCEYLHGDWNWINMSGLWEWKNLGRVPVKYVLIFLWGLWVVWGLRLLYVGIGINLLFIWISELTIIIPYHMDKWPA